MEENEAKRILARIEREARQCLAQIRAVGEPDKLPAWERAVYTANMQQFEMVLSIISNDSMSSLLKLKAIEQVTAASKVHDSNIQ